MGEHRLKLSERERSIRRTRWNALKEVRPSGGRYLHVSRQLIQKPVHGPEGKLIGSELVAVPKGARIGNEPVNQTYSVGARKAKIARRVAKAERRTAMKAARA